MRPLWIMMMLFILATGDQSGHLRHHASLSDKRVIIEHRVRQSHSRLIKARRDRGRGVGDFLRPQDRPDKDPVRSTARRGHTYGLPRCGPRRLYRHSAFFAGGGDNGILPFGARMRRRSSSAGKREALATGVIVAFGILFGGGAVPYLLGLSGDLVSFRLGISILGLLVCLSSPLAFALKEATSDECRVTTLKQGGLPSLGTRHSPLSVSTFARPSSV